MTISRSSPNQCMGCGKAIGPSRHFCDSDECFDSWAYGPGSGLILNPGYSILPKMQEAPSANSKF